MIAAGLADLCMKMEIKVTVRRSELPVSANAGPMFRNLCSACPVTSGEIVIVA
jgi:hypothetical protein